MSDTIDLSTVAVLARVTITVWQAGAVDKEATQETAKTYDASSTAFHIFKRLMPPKSPYHALTSAVQAAREAHRAQTMPWGDNKDRILPTTNFETYSAIMSKHRQICDDADATFCRVYQDLKEQMRERATALGELFKDSDYPASVDGIYTFNVHISPLATAGDFRVNLSDTVLDAYRAKLVMTQQKALHDAIRSLLVRLQTAAVGLLDQIKDLGGRLYQESFDNLEALCDTVERLNVTGAVDVATSLQQVRAVFLQYSAQDLRNSVLDRRDVAQDAQAIVDQMKGLLG